MTKPIDILKQTLKDIADGDLRTIKQSKNEYISILANMTPNQLNKMRKLLEGGYKK